MVFFLAVQEHPPLEQKYIQGVLFRKNMKQSEIISKIISFNPNQKRLGQVWFKIY
jgi:hypothetical protein